jgi:hypothetical protein
LKWLCMMLLVSHPLSLRFVDLRGVIFTLLRGTCRPQAPTPSLFARFIGMPLSPLPFEFRLAVVPRISSKF